MTSSSTQPGWHPDPEGVPNQLRWREGLQWTSATRPIGYAPQPSLGGHRQRYGREAVAISRHELDDLGRQLNALRDSFPGEFV
ncbi:DUF2510 domain-containing protein [Nocardia sp. 348MFTsu5.1]|uniref:DUF2510 domain-containing protein n=1 Tax=Nocardia sp. 348MFTsu5.1 TaxID=1172185 RepID=UPI000561AA6D